MSKYFFVFTFVSLLTNGYRGGAQNFPVYNSYYVNPYLYNPAEAASDYTYVYLNQRQQWSGVEGAPVLSTINVTTILNNTHSGVGGKISSFKRGLLTTTDFSATYAYGAPLTKKSTLLFGLSGGAINSTLDATKYTGPADPALDNYLQNNFQPTGNFGMLYRSASGLNLGFTLPQLFAPIYNAPSNFSGSGFSAFDNVIISAYFKRKVQGKLVNGKKKGIRTKIKTKETTAPLELYTMYKYAKAGNSQFEVLGKLNLSEKFWLGASYRQSYGFSGMIGLVIGRMLVGYAYEPGGQPQSGFSTGTHEVQLGIRLGQLKKFRRYMPVIRSTLKTTTEQHMARFQQTVEDTDQIEVQEGETKKFLVVIKSFSDFNAADLYKKKLIADKFNANIFYYEKDKKYYVHVLESATSGEAHEEVKNLKSLTKLKEARVLMIIHKEKK